jgi:hypothetical protein
MTDIPDSRTDHIARAFQQLVDERKKLAKIVTKEESAERVRDKESVDAASTLTIERIVKEFADLQLTVDHTAEELANTLLVETAKLAQVRRAIQVETGHMRELAHIEIAANALDILTQAKQAEIQAFETQVAQQEEAFAREVAAQRAAWEREAQAHHQEVAAYDESLQRERSQAEADFRYELERKRRIELDKFEADKRTKEQEMAETERTKLQDWALRESAVAEQEQACEAYRAQLEAFPAELEQAVAMAGEQALQTASEEAQIKTDLFAKEIAANQQVRELHIQSLEETIIRQNEQIEALSAELKETLKQAQTLAFRAISGASAETPLSE